MTPPFRIGFGYDVHPFITGRPLFLGGVAIPHTHGLDGHSDADALLHAVCDALLGAAGLRDIGIHFPNDDPRFKNIDSGLLLAETCTLIRAEGYAVGNVDATVVAEAPRLQPYVSAMCARMAELLEIAAGQVAVKATTNESMGFVGRREGVAAYAVCLIYRFTAS